MAGVPKSRRHGLRRTPEYQVWADMLRRCLSPDHPHYKDWGGRGITVCEQWRDFRVFYADMGPRPPAPPRTFLERVNNDMGYAPGNCVWATAAVQHRNTRQTRRITIDGETRCLKDWCRQYNIDYTTVKGRIYKRGWPPLKAVTTPVDPAWPAGNLAGAH